MDLKNGISTSFVLPDIFTNISTVVDHHEVAASTTEPTQHSKVDELVEIMGLNPVNAVIEGGSKMAAVVAATNKFL